MPLIALDLDGTLEDSRQDMVGVARRVRALLDLPARPDSSLQAWVSGGMERLYRACFDDFLLEGDIEQRLLHVRLAYERDYLAHVAVETRLYEGMADALVELSRLGSLACVTNKPERISRVLLEALGVGRWFGAVVGGDTCAQSKPHPIMLATAAARCRVDPKGDHCIMIGDALADIQLGRTFGATTVWCAWGYQDTPTEEPNCRADSPRELPALVRGVLSEKSTSYNRAGA